GGATSRGRLRWSSALRGIGGRSTSCDESGREKGCSSGSTSQVLCDRGGTANSVGSPRNERSRGPDRSRNCSRWYSPRIPRSDSPFRRGTPPGSDPEYPAETSTEN